MKRTMNEFLNENNISFERVMSMYYCKCIEEGKYNMLLNAKNFIVNFNLNNDELKNVYVALKSKYDFVSEV